MKVLTLDIHKTQRPLLWHHQSVASEPPLPALYCGAFYTSKKGPCKEGYRGPSWLPITVSSGPVSVRGCGISSVSGRGGGESLPSFCQPALDVGTTPAHQAIKQKKWPIAKLCSDGATEYLHCLTRAPSSLTQGGPGVICCQHWSGEYSAMVSSPGDNSQR